jgi:hypothetical protein
LDQPHHAHGHVELVAVEVFENEKVALLILQSHEAAVYAYAVVDVHDVVADTQIGKARDGCSSPVLLARTTPRVAPKDLLVAGDNEADFIY